MTDKAEAGELIGQGSAGGALASQLNIDMGLESYFSGSVDEVNYGSVRLQPISFQDDIARMARDVQTAQAGNVKLASLMKEKQLEVHPDKTCYIIMGGKKFKERVLEELRESPIMFGDIETRCKEKDKYLGDMLHTDGLAASVEATVNERAGKIKAAIYEVAAIMEDFRMQAMGGLMGAWDLWNMAIVPSLLSNCGVWTEIQPSTTRKLEELQETFVRRMLHVPQSTPKVSLRSETGLMAMKHRIWIEKVRMVMAIQKLDDKALASVIYREQLSQGWPGLAREVKLICEEINIPDVNCHDLEKSHIRRAIEEHHKCEIIEEMKKREKKLGDLVENETARVKDYMMLNNIADSRTMFRIRTKMLELKANMKNMYGEGNMACDACSTGTIESQGHVLDCPGYAELRDGLDLSKMKDLVTYFREVMVQRLNN